MKRERAKKGKYVKKLQAKRVGFSFSLLFFLASLLSSYIYIRIYVEYIVKKLYVLAKTQKGDFFGPFPTPLRTRLREGRRIYGIQLKKKKKARVEKNTRAPGVAREVGRRGSGQKGRKKSWRGGASRGRGKLARRGGGRTWNFGKKISINEGKLFFFLVPPGIFSTTGGAFFSPPLASRPPPPPRRRQVRNVARKRAEEFFTRAEDVCGCGRWVLRGWAAYEEVGQLFRLVAQNRVITPLPSPPGNFFFRHKGTRGQSRVESSRCTSSCVNPPTPQPLVTRPS